MDVDYRLTGPEASHNLVEVLVIEIRGVNNCLAVSNIHGLGIERRNVSIQS
jgi:hypothetical protein